MRPLQRRDGVIVGAVGRIGANGHKDRRMHAGAGAEELCIGVVADLLVGFGILGEGARIDQAGVVQSLDVGQAFLPFRFVGDGVDLAVVQDQVGAVVGIDEAVHQVGQGAHTVVFDGTAQRHFIGLAVAVGVLGLEGFQHGLELFGGLWHFQPQLLQPFAVHPHLVGKRTVVAFDQLRDAVDVAVGRRRHGLQGRIVVQGGLDVWTMFLDQIIQGDDHALLPIFQQIELRELIDPGDQHVQIRVVAAGQRNLALFLGGVAIVRSGLPLKLDAELLLCLFGEGVGCQVHIGSLRRENLDLDRAAGGLRFASWGSSRRLGWNCAGATRQHHAHDHEQCNK